MRRLNNGTNKDINKQIHETLEKRTLNLRHGILDKRWKGTTTNENEKRSKLREKQRAYVQFSTSKLNEGEYYQQINNKEGEYQRAGILDAR